MNIDKERKEEHKTKNLIELRFERFYFCSVIDRRLFVIRLDLRFI